jgi:diguanylate cyclase (GGDEF)-like protein
MEHQIFNEIIKSKHYLNPFALLMIDADHFKNFNDRMGHIMGDIALKDISVRLKSLLKREDSIARFGGEEFCIMLPKTNEIKALSVAEKLCSIIRASKIVGALSQPLGYFSVSIGIAIYPYDIALLNNNSLNELIYVADAALYAAKRAGRNRAVLFSKI